MGKTLTEVLDITEQTLKKAGFSWYQVLDTKKMNGDWHIKADVGVGKSRFVTVVINDETGEPKAIIAAKTEPGNTDSSQNT